MRHRHHLAPTKDKAIAIRLSSASGDSVQLGLAEFIRQNVAPITVEWISFAKTLTPASEGMTKLALQDHIEEILTFVADDLESPQTQRQQAAKSRGLGPAESELAKSAAEIHAALRLSDGFNIDQMVSEYRALRASVVKQWISRCPRLESTDLNDLTRFNEAIDQTLAESVAHYTKEVEQARNLFLGVLGHDLRNPLGAASMTAQRMLQKGDLDARQTSFTSQIVSTVSRATQIVNDLIDVSRSAFGNEMPIAKARMDIGDLAQRLVDEMIVLSPNRAIELVVSGDTVGDWDGGRIGQVFSNLIGNALQHSSGQSPVTVAIQGNLEEVILSIHNSGPPMPVEKLKGLFEAGNNGRGRGSDVPGSFNLGLGLFIVRKIVMAHAGDITVVSTAEAGTTFIVTLPRR